MGTISGQKHQKFFVTPSVLRFDFEGGATSKMKSTKVLTHHLPLASYCSTSTEAMIISSPGAALVAA